MMVGLQAKSCARVRHTCRAVVRGRGRGRRDITSSGGADTRGRRRRVREFPRTGQGNGRRRRRAASATCTKVRASAPLYPSSGSVVTGTGRVRGCSGGCGTSACITLHYRDLARYVWMAPQLASTLAGIHPRACAYRGTVVIWLACHVLPTPCSYYQPQQMTQC